MIEKDYVLGWLLFGLSGIRELTFKGGTALSKVYFPRIWRLSEDLDYVYKKDFQDMVKALPAIFERIEKLSGIRLALKTRRRFREGGTREGAIGLKPLSASIGQNLRPD
jgi:hypothetical protein